MNANHFVQHITPFKLSDRSGDDRYGPEAWCHYCSRKHPRRKHDLVEVERVAKSGKTVTRWAHAS